MLRWCQMRIMQVVASFPNAHCATLLFAFGSTYQMTTSWLGYIQWLEETMCFSVLFLWRDVICLWLVNQNGLPHKQLLQLFLFIIIIINLFIPPTSKTWRWRNNKLWTMSFRDTCLPVIFLSRPAGVGHSFTLLASWCSGWNSWAAGPDWKQSPLCQRQRNKYVFTFRSFLESPCCSPFALLDTVILPVQSDSVSCRKYSRPVNFVTICHSTTRNLIPWDLMR